MGVVISALGCIITNYGRFTGIDGVDIPIQHEKLVSSEEGYRVLENMESLNWGGWASLLALSALGVTAYFCMTEALRVISPTSVSVVRALEIVMAYGLQVSFTRNNSPKE